MRAAREALPVSPAPQPTGTARSGRRWRLSSARGRFLGCARPPLLDDTLREPHRETVDRDAKSDDTDRFRVVSRHSNRRATARGGTAKGCLGHCYLGRADIRGGAEAAASAGAACAGFAARCPRRVHATAPPQALLRARDVWDACAALKRRDLAIGARAGAQRIGAPRRGGRRGARGGVGRARTGRLRERPSRRRGDLVLLE